MPLKGAVDPTTLAIYRHILKTFGETGHPPSGAMLAAAHHLPDLATVHHYLAALEAGGGLYRDPAMGDILAAYPFSAVPTAHRVELKAGHQAYAMCAIDALGIPLMLDTDVTIHSLCAHCGKELSLQITSGTITTVAPAEIVVGCASAPANCCAATDQCPFINFFCGPPHAQAWQERYAHLTTKRMSLAEAFEHGRRVFSHLLR